MNAHVTALIQAILDALGGVIPGIATLVTKVTSIDNKFVDPLPTAEQNLPLPVEEQNLPLPVNEQNLPLPVEEQNLPLPVQLASAVVSVEVEGVVDDDAAVGVTKPVVVGGVHIADPAADTLEDGDAGYALLNEQRMQVTESRAYDPVSDADKNIPVVDPNDAWTPEDLSSSLGSDGSVTKYVIMLPAKRFSLQFIPAPDGAEVIALTLAVSNEVTGDVTTQTYTDVTSDLTGAATITAEDVINPANPVDALTLCVIVTVSGRTVGMGTSAWDLFLVKGVN